MQALQKIPLLTDPLEAMLQGCRNSELKSQEKLYRHCYPQFINICLRYAGDMDGAGIIFNNAMIRVFKFLHKYEHQQKWMAWIKTIVVNCCIDFVKSKNKFREELIKEHHEAQASINNDVFDKISVKDIQRFIREMPTATATVFNLFVYEGFTHKQISVSLGISEGTSKWHISEGRRLLKSKVEAYIKF